ncbi:RecE family exodeoxyribonuclease [Escherichia coli]|uniref:RecE family exodeoxyribonuclease n=1 Tax=Escherichia coli TaxID=562 RepID=UPI0007A5C158|nr:RecE family exodeoxyribonuclease [Escherichia coli]HDQ6530831.1 exodeoxyribonuclease VIII [Escherichia coli O75:H8]EFA9076975.1 exodeoxyribonuclease VIII [Escherichia coli]EFG3812828.1 exodeoxyribonuclease VIII [Escherichia coli]EFK0917031.1 exodeoxyribonuclease VIII [Escherichia coli]EGK3910114.1 exodeoxyribonuclease VIII [Escherichia coli]
MSADKQTFALHCEAKNDKVRKRLDIKGGFFWTEARKLSVAVSRCIAAMDDAGYDEDDFKKPVRVNFPVVNDLPPEGVFDTEFCNRYEKGGNDGITMMAIPFDDNINGEDATTAGDDNDNLDGTIPDDVEKSESPDSDDDCSECEIPVATLSLTHRFLHLFLFSKDEDGKYRHHATPEQRNNVIRMEMDTEDSYLQSLLTAVRAAHHELDKLTNHHLSRLAESVGKEFPHSANHRISPAEFDKFISTWMKTDYVDQGLLAKEWQKGNYITGITRTPSGANAGGGNLTDRGEGFTHNQASLARDIATGVLARSMDVDIYNLHPAHAKRVEEIVSENKPPFSVFRDKFIAMPGGLDYSRAIVVASVKEAPIGIEAIPARVTEYLNKVLTETDHSNPDPEIVEIACGRSSAPMPQRGTAEEIHDDEEKQQTSDAMSNEQAAPESVEEIPVKHNADTQSLENVSSVETKYQELRAELHEARKNISPKNPVDADKLLAASRGEFVEGISAPTDPKWIKGIQARDTEDQNQSKVEQIAPEAGQNSPDTQQNGPEEQQPAPVAQPELEKNCRVCGQTGGGNCPDCSAVMGDSTYTETFGENDAADGEDSAQTEEKIIQENSVDAAQEGETVVQNEPGSDTSGDDANSEPVTLDWKRQLVIAAVYGLCANPACIATAPAIPDIAIMIANRLENFGGDKS